MSDDGDITVKKKKKLVAKLNADGSLDQSHTLGDLIHIRDYGKPMAGTAVWFTEYNTSQ